MIITAMLPTVKKNRQSKISTQNSGRRQGYHEEKPPFWACLLLLCAGLVFRCAYAAPAFRDMAQLIAWTNSVMELAAPQQMGKRMDIILSSKLDFIPIAAIGASGMQFNNNGAVCSAGETSPAPLYILAYFTKPEGLHISQKPVFVSLCPC